LLSGTERLSVKEVELLGFTKTDEPADELEGVLGYRGLRVHDVEEKFTLPLTRLARNVPPVKSPTSVGVGLGPLILTVEAVGVGVVGVGVGVRVSPFGVGAVSTTLMVRTIFVICALPPWSSRTVRVKGKLPACALGRAVSPCRI
jgi:hypothetical protein